MTAAQAPFAFAHPNPSRSVKATPFGAGIEEQLDPESLSVEDAIIARIDAERAEQITALALPAAAVPVDRDLFYHWLRPRRRALAAAARARVPFHRLPRAVDLARYMSALRATA